MLSGMIGALLAAGLPAGEAAAAAAFVHARAANLSAADPGPASTRRRRREFSATSAPPWPPSSSPSKGSTVPHHPSVPSHSIAPPTPAGCSPRRCRRCGYPTSRWTRGGLPVHPRRADA
ncbi:carbohydrate kinase family protein [Mycobacterium xenopi 3993]|nr:carbohydrate kinase family protein [Mycobacterium xenopi 3993]